MNSVERGEDQDEERANVRRKKRQQAQSESRSRGGRTKRHSTRSRRQDIQDAARLGAVNVTRTTTAAGRVVVTGCHSTGQCAASISGEQTNLAHDVTGTEG